MSLSWGVLELPGVHALTVLLLGNASRLRHQIKSGTLWTADEAVTSTLE